MRSNEETFICHKYMHSAILFLHIPESWGQSAGLAMIVERTVPLIQGPNSGSLSVLGFEP